MLNKEVLEAISYVLRYSSRSIIHSIDNKKPSDSEIETLIKSCNQLAESKIYAFNTDCSMKDLQNQIQEFSTKL